MICSFDPGLELFDYFSGSVQLVAAGGISQPMHIARLEKIGIDGAVVGKALYEGDVDWKDFVNAG